MADDKVVKTKEVDNPKKRKLRFKIIHDFSDFLKEYKIISLAMAFIMGLAANQLIKSLVDNVVMPFISPVMSSGGWQKAVLNLGPIAIKWGQFLSDVIYFLVIALVVFLVAKFIFREEKVTKK